MCSLDPEKLKQSEMYNFKRKIRDVNELGKKVIEYIYRRTWRERRTPKKFNR